MPINPHPLRRFTRNEDGAVAIIVALMLTVLFGFVAFGVDLGQIYRDQNRLQAQADLAAMGAVVELESAEARAGTMLDRNGSTPDALKDLRFGRYMLDPNIPHEQRFTELQFLEEGANAVQLDVSKATPLTFSWVLLNRDSIDLNATATAMSPNGASFTLGSGLARINSQLSGANISLTAVDYKTLLGGQVTLLGFLDELGTEIGFESGNYVDLLDLDVGLPEVLASLARTQTGQAADILNQLAAAVGPDNLELSQLVSIVGNRVGLTIDDFLNRNPNDLQLTALDFLYAALDFLPENENWIDLNLGVNVLGLEGVDAKLRLLEHARSSGRVFVGQPNAKLHTAQTRLSTKLKLDPDLLGSLGVGVKALELRLPLYLELASAETELIHANCRPERSDTVVAVFQTGPTMDGANGPRVTELFLGHFNEERLLSGQKLTPLELGYADLLDISVEVRVPLLPSIKLGLLTLQAKGHAVVGASETDFVFFTNQNVLDGNTRASLSTNEALSTAISSLLGGNGLSIRVKPQHQSIIGALLAPVVNAVLALLQNGLLLSVAGIVDTVLDATLDVAGVNVGNADLELLSSDCGTPRLVQ